MPRRSLRPNLNQIRAWVRQGRTDAGVAHQLDGSVRDIEQFKRQNELTSDEAPPEGTLAAEYPDEIDLRAEDDALVAAELEAAEIEAERARSELDGLDASDEQETSGEPAPRRARRRGGRGRRGLAGRGRATAGSGTNLGPLEGTFDHGEEGYGLWLDPPLPGNPIYAEPGARPPPVPGSVAGNRTLIRPAGAED